MAFIKKFVNNKSNKKLIDIFIKNSVNLICIINFQRLFPKMAPYNAYK